ncbi:MAG: hypothetical protein KGJ36_01060 [Acidobacteriota bacterium]|nr:hypothetical protein [Acidobacteriota bacterium]
MPERKRLAHAWIIAGFSLLALSAVVSVVAAVRHGFVGRSDVRFDVQLFLDPLGALAAVWAWRALGQVAVEESRHARLFRTAFLALGAEMATFALTDGLYLSSSPRLTQYSASTWVGGTGSLAAALGFWMMSREFAPSAPATGE